jgi:nucleotide-binding universal stress UspA family protein
MYKHILIPTDGSPLSEAAARNGVQLAKQLNAKVTAFYAAPVYEHRPPVEGSSYTGPTRHQDEEEARKNAEQALAGVSKLAKDQGVPADGHWAFTNHPYEGIIETAKTHGCDLIFMASHGRSGVKALVLGSETNKVLTHCHIPVLVCR